MKKVIDFIKLNWPIIIAGILVLYLISRMAQ